MVLTLDNKDLARLVAGHDLAAMEYTHKVRMSYYQQLGLGSYTGGFNDKWDWNLDALEKLSPMRLYNIWQELKNAPPQIIK